jgi:hypothetical protein
MAAPYLDCISAFPCPPTPMPPTLHFTSSNLCCHNQDRSSLLYPFEFFLFMHMCLVPACSEQRPIETTSLSKPPASPQCCHNTTKVNVASPQHYSQSAYVRSRHIIQYLRMLKTRIRHVMVRDGRAVSDSGLCFSLSPLCSAYTQR